MKAVVVGLSFFWAGAAVAIPSFYGPLEEDPDGTVWMEEEAEDGADRPLDAWRADGRFERYIAPFSPFTQRDPRGLGGAGLAVRPMAIAGAFGFVIDGSILYRKNADGAFVAGPVFEDAGGGGPLPCDDSLKGCFLGPKRTDTLGNVYYLTYSLSDVQTHVLIETDGVVRRASGAAARLSDDNFRSGGDSPTPGPFVRFAGREEIVIPADYEFAYDIVGPDRVERRVVGAPAGTDPIRFMFYLRSGAFFAGRIISIDPMRASYALELYRINDPLAETAAAELVGTVPVSPYAGKPVADATHLYYMNPDRGMSAIRLADGIVSLVEGTASCVSGSALLADGPGERVYGACDNKLQVLSGGRVVQTAEAGSSLYAVRGVNERTVVGFSYDGSMIRLTDGVATRVKTSVAEIERAASARSGWVEDGLVCGAFLSAAGTLDARCRYGARWLPAPDLPAFIETGRYPDALWGIAVVDGRYVVYRRPDNGVWVEMARLDEEVVSDRIPRFVLSEGFAGVAIDPPSWDHILRWDGGQFVRQNASDARVASSSGGGGYAETPVPAGGGRNDLRPVLDRDGALYARCRDGLCRIAADGSVTAIAGPETILGEFMPLARGVLLRNFDEPYVYRGVRMIPLTRLFGELQGTSDRRLRLRLVQVLGTGVVIQAYHSDEFGDIDSLAYYAYDGITLEAYPETLVAAAGVRLQSGNVVTGTADSTSANTGYGTNVAVWKDSSGAYRRGLSSFSAASLSELSAAFADNTDQNQNKVMGIARLGDGWILGTSKGAVLCADAAGAALSGPATFSLTQGCRKLREEGPIRAVARLGMETLILENRTVAHFADQELETRDVLSRGVVDRFREERGGAVWIENGSTLAHLGTDRVVERFDGPAEFPIVAASAQYACGPQGVAFRRGGAWVAVAGVSRCGDMIGDGGSGLALTPSGVVPLTDGVAGEALPLPAPAHDDVVLGTVDGKLGIAVGTRVFALSAGRFTDATPRWAQGSALRARVLYMGADGIGTDGGGAVSAGAEPRFFRSF